MRLDERPLVVVAALLIAIAACAPSKGTEESEEALLKLGASPDLPVLVVTVTAEQTTAHTVYTLTAGGRLTVKATGGEYPKGLNIERDLDADQADAILRTVATREMVERDAQDVEAELAETRMVVDGGTIGVRLNVPRYQRGSHAEAPLRRGWSIRIPVAGRAKTRDPVVRILALMKALRSAAGLEVAQ